MAIASPTVESAILATRRRKKKKKWEESMCPMLNS
jgi:hypothetical protein